MTQQNRMLLVLGAFGLVGTLVLVGLANRYGKILERRAGSGSRPATSASLGPSPAKVGAESIDDALHRVDAFLAVRRALKDAIERGRADASANATGADRRRTVLREVRDAAAERAGLDPVAYLEIRSRYRAWKSGAAGGAPDALSTALALRAEELGRVDLGDDEDLDP